MLYLAYFIYVFASAQLIVSLVNLIFSQPFPKSKLQLQPLVSVLIPARNEEKNISNILDDLKNQKYNNLEIIIFDDESTDKTAEIVSAKSQTDERIILINSEGLPKGWLGKNFACHSLAKQAKGEFMLFLDADVRVGSNIIIDTITQLRKHNLSLLSIFPKQKMHSWGERITVPNMNFILLSLLPLVLVRSSKRPSLSAANGQFMLFESLAYKKLLPHEKMRSKKVEDIEIAKFFKKEGLKIACLTGKEEISCRMYKSFREAVNGFSKNVIMFFGNSFTCAILFWLVTTLGFLVVWFYMPIQLFVIFLVLILFTRIFISFGSRQNVIINLLLIIPQQLSMGLFIYKAIINKIRKEHQWKGRNIY